MITSKVRYMSISRVKSSSFFGEGVLGRAVVATTGAEGFFLAADDADEGASVSISSLAISR